MKALLVFLCGFVFLPAQERTPIHNRVAGKYEKREHKGKQGRLTYYLMKPAKYDKEKKYPLVVCLHGRGGNTKAGTVVAGDEMRKKYPCFALAPSVTRKERWASPADRGDGRGSAIGRVLATIEELLTEFSIDPDRIYVTGQSMGGYGSFGALAKAPDRFAAAAPVCGGWSPADAKSFAHVPLWAFHGDKDPTVPVDASRRMIEAIRKAGGDPKYSEYKGVKHNSWDRAYGEDALWKWMFDQKRKPKDEDK